MKEQEGEEAGEDDGNNRSPTCFSPLHGKDWAGGKLPRGPGAGVSAGRTGGLCLRVCWCWRDRQREEDSPSSY